LTGNRLTIAYTSWSIAPVAVAVGIFWCLLGGLGVLITGLIALPWLAWRYDNETGAFLPLAVLLLLVCGVLGLVLFLTAIVFFAGR
jgi:hypothetical protein